ncbi:MAG: NifB/NifX family molybdenum-iron cluster-binding protein [Bacteroidota bacterium]|nr:NifB/NifX family molybdenum-iron cluster-binding protein [Bacteroidota bacterium]
MDSIKLRVAFATDDGKVFMKRHFGDAMFYDIYEISEEESSYVKRIENTTSEEEIQHADIKKAKGISSLLKHDGVHIVVSQVFGPNIKRIKKKFAPLIVKEPYIAKTINIIQQNFSIILKEWENEIERKPVML